MSVASVKTRKDFFNTEEGEAIKRQLLQMVESHTYNTGSSYSADSVAYPDNLIPFVNKHMDYLITHPALEANTYLANLKLMTKVR